MRIAHRPVDNTAVHLCAARSPGGPAAQRQGRSLPCIGHRPGVAGLGNGHELPCFFPGGGLIGSQESANPIVAAAYAGEDEIAHHQRRGGPAILSGRALVGVDVPQQGAVQTVESDQMGVVGEIEDPVS